MAKRSGQGTALRDVCAVLEELAPTRLAQSWDNVGLLAGDLSARVRRVLLCIDLMPKVVSEAKKKRCDLVVAYHPPIFRPIARLVMPNEGMEAQVFRCLSSGMAVYSPHTALDSARGGTNDVLLELCGARCEGPLEPTLDDATVGMGRIGRFEEHVSLASLCRRLKKKTGAGCLSLVGDPKARLKRVVVVVGAAGALPFALKLGAGDVVVTGEMRHHDALRLRRLGAHAVVLSHWSSERPALSVLASRLQAGLSDVSVKVSEADCEPFQRG
jgi:dinuclear metal center YbgI/SA1388 family protein